MLQAHAAALPGESSTPSAPGLTGGESSSARSAASLLSMIGSSINSKTDMQDHLAAAPPPRGGAPLPGYADAVRSRGAVVRESFEGFQLGGSGAGAQLPLPLLLGPTLPITEAQQFASPLAMWLGSTSDEPADAPASSPGPCSPSGPMTNSERRRLIQLERVASLAGQLYERGRWHELGAVLGSVRIVDVVAAQVALVKQLQATTAGEGGPAGSSSSKEECVRLGCTVEVAGGGVGLPAGPLRGVVRYIGPCHWEAGEG